MKVFLWFLPQNVTKTDLKYTQAKVVVYILAFGVLSNLAALLLHQLFSKIIDFPFLELAALCFVLLFLFKKTGLIKLVGNLFTFLISAALLKTILNTGGTYSVNFQFIFFLPLVAFVTAGFSSGLVWAIVCTLKIIWIYYYVSGNDLLYKNQILTYDNGYYTTVAFNILMFVTILIAVFHAQLNGLINQLRATKKALKQSNTELSHYAHITSHDLKQPVNTLEGFNKVLSRHLENKGWVDERVNESLKATNLLTNKMATLIDGLLAYAKLIDVETIPFEIKSLDDILNETLLNFKGRIDEKKVFIESSGLPRLPIIPLKINQLFQNLIDNAIKYGKKNEPALIKISSLEKKAHYEIRISDNGIGIEDKDLEKIFLLFNKIHHEEKYAGSGIGLATCERIVHLHGGKIWVESSFGVGSRFIFTLSKTPPIC